MNLAHYFERIGFEGATRPDLDTLSAVMAAHVYSVPFENLDVQLGRHLTTEIDEAFEKIVKRRRGGWCYEQNGVFGWALSTIGFDVTRVAANVMRQDNGDASANNHLALLVRIPGHGSRQYLADVGFGGSLLRPLPFMEVRQDHAPFRIELADLGDGHWRFSENLGTGPFSYDFVPEAAVESKLEAKCQDLQTDPESSFVLNLTAQVRRPDHHIALRGRVLKTARSKGVDKRLLDSADELVACLRDVFSLDVDGVAELWPRIVARHDDLFGA